MRDVLTEAATTAEGRELLLSADGKRDLFGEALYMIGVPEPNLRDCLTGAHYTIVALGALTVYIESGVMWHRGKREDALQWARLWAARRTVGEIRRQLMEAGIPIEERIDTEEKTHAVSR
jgi:hypothetical protein